MGKSKKRNPRESRNSKEAAAAKKFKKRPCFFCKEKVSWIDYKDVNLLKRYISDRGKIRARRVTGNCEQHQHEVSMAIKTSREIALLPYTQRLVTERSSRPSKSRDYDPDEGPPIRIPRPEEFAMAGPEALATPDEE